MWLSPAGLRAAVLATGPVERVPALAAAYARFALAHRGRRRDPTPITRLAGRGGVTSPRPSVRK